MREIKLEKVENLDNNLLFILRKYDEELQNIADCFSTVVTDKEYRHIEKMFEKVKAERRKIIDNNLLPFGYIDLIK